MVAGIAPASDTHLTALVDASDDYYWVAPTNGRIAEISYADQAGTLTIGTWTLTTPAGSIVATFAGGGVEGDGEIAELSASDPAVYVAKGDIIQLTTAVLTGTLLVVLTIRQ